ncbi:hypothetical protein XU18_0856 [Perkinsela sp. CCAP 1560/4]|nr:hypothetical protein XU18_0856 [Perkinsela sp. CCAP 1560/4]|eukprot:KNH08659.1 hypothetical protein XU18_0856 [Perkinsela sp. CCAP 1560/4]
MRKAESMRIRVERHVQFSNCAIKKTKKNKKKQFFGSVHLTQLPAALKNLNLITNHLSADLTEGHLFVVGWTSTPSWGKPRAFQALVVFLFWRRPYRRPPQGGGSGPVPIHREVQETAVSCHVGSRIPLVARRENVHSFSVVRKAG